ncbi:hypothetical protein [Moraxella oblonga]|uniref:hypothetical protein n=1 Tax=Moraxella oblonga TaxID=200413 RepID=UPI000836D499|nr:hypothetical protein [Moraxella oblonga]
MPTLILLLFMAYAQDNSNQPTYIWAGGFALINLVLTIINGGGLLGGVIGAVILGLYAWGYFAILRKFSDQTALWLMLCVGGLVLPIIAVFAQA